jgi:hypothetical protein
MSFLQFCLGSMVDYWKLLVWQQKGGAEFERFSTLVLRQ